MDVIHGFDRTHRPGSAAPPCVYSRRVAMFTEHLQRMPVLALSWKLDVSTNRAKTTAVAIAWSMTGRCASSTYVTHSPPPTSHLSSPSAG